MISDVVRLFELERRHVELINKLVDLCVIMAEALKLANAVTEDRPETKMMALDLIKQSESYVGKWTPQKQEIIV